MTAIRYETHGGKPPASDAATAAARVGRIARSAGHGALPAALSDPELALVEVARWLGASDYAFTVITPESHRRVAARRDRANTIRDVFGWSSPFSRGLLPEAIVDALTVADALSERDGLLTAKVRYASLGGRIYVHSSYPTDSDQAVFFGPDTYRFCSALARHVTTAARVVDIGCGSGAGALSIAARCSHLVLTDRNPLALSYARVNAALAGVLDRVELVGGDLLEHVSGALDLVIANPPYIAGDEGKLYCNGGGGLGTEIALRIVDQAMGRLSSGGHLVLYSGAPIVDGEDTLRTAIAARLGSARWTYEELDPDVFGEELERPAYAQAHVERIAAVVLVATL